MNLQDQNLKIISNYLKETFNPVHLYFYGSRANNTHTNQSDYDFVLVTQDFNSKDRFQFMEDMDSYFRKNHNIEVQIWRYSLNDFNEWKSEFSSIPETAVSTGQEINLG